MSPHIIDVLLLTLSFLTLGYLTFALIKPERF